MAGGWLRASTKLVTAVGLLGGMSLLVPSCADNGVTVFIRGVMAVQAPDCVPKPDADTVLWSSVAFDVAVTSTVEVPLLIGSQLYGRGDPKTSRAEPNRIQFTGAEVELTNTNGGQLVPKFTVPTIGMVDPTASSDASYGVVWVSLVPSGVAAALTTAAGIGTFGASRLILANVKVFGKTLAGTEVETLPVSIQVNACFGCSVDFPGDAVDPTAGAFNCLKPSTQKKTCLPGVQLTSCQDCRFSPYCYNCASDTECAPLGPGRKCNTAIGRCAP